MISLTRLTFSDFDHHQFIKLTFFYNKKLSIPDAQNAWIKFAIERDKSEYDFDILVKIYDQLILERAISIDFFVCGFGSVCMDHISDQYGHYSALVQILLEHF